MKKYLGRPSLDHLPNNNGVYRAAPALAKPVDLLTDIVLVFIKILSKKIFQPLAVIVPSEQSHCVNIWKSQIHKVAGK